MITHAQSIRRIILVLLLLQAPLLSTGCYVAAGAAGGAAGAVVGEEIAEEDEDED